MLQEQKVQKYLEQGQQGILASNNSEVINSGRIEGKTGTNLVGISADNTSTVANEWNYNYGYSF